MRSLRPALCKFFLFVFFQDSDLFIQRNLFFLADFVLEDISGVIIWNIVSGYIKDVIDEAVKTEPVVEQVADVPSFQSEPECSFSVIIRDSTGKCIEVKYDGPVSGMEEAGEQIKIIAGDGK